MATETCPIKLENIHCMSCFFQGDDGCGYNEIVGKDDLKTDVIRPDNIYVIDWLNLIASLETCPKCSLSWKAVTESLKEPIGSDNHLLAWRMINSCDVCGLRFLKEIEEIRDVQKMASRLKKEWGDDGR